MKSKLLNIKQTSEIIGVSIQTLRRWDDSKKLVAVRKKKTGHRYYNIDDIKNYMGRNAKDLFKLAKAWVMSDSNIEPRSDFYCLNSYIFQARLSKLESELKEIKTIKNMFPLITAISGEIGNNSFDHNLGNWPDVPGIFFAYDLKKKQIILADKGQGVLTTLKRVKPELKNHHDALFTAFTEIISGRAPEARGNGLKFVKNVVINNDIELFFQTGDAYLKIKRQDLNLNIKESSINIQGCLVLIKF